MKILPAALIVPLFYWIGPLILFFRFLVGTIFGVFLLSVGLYIFSLNFGDVRPFTFAQLVLWLDALPTDSKTAVITSLLTVIGFLVAFHAATINWKAQALAHLKVNVAGELEVFFNEASRHIVSAKLYVQSLIDIVNSIQQHEITADHIFNIRRSQEKYAEFIDVRDRLSVMSIEVHRLTGNHGLVLSTIWGATKAIDESTAAFMEITGRMWIHVPIIDDQDIDPTTEFIRQVNVTECIDFIESCEKNYLFISGMVGGVRGSLLSSLISINFSTILSMAEKKSSLTEAISKMQDR